MKTWPPEVPSQRSFPTPDSNVPELRYEQEPSAERKRRFADLAFQHFASRVIRRIAAVNRALHNYHGGRGSLEDYRAAVTAYREMVERPERLGLHPRFWIEHLEVNVEVNGDYAMSARISGAVRFPSNNGPDGESSSSSSSYPVLPASWP